MVARGDGFERVGAVTPAPDAGAEGSSVGGSKKNKTRGVFEMRTTEPAGASSPASPPCSPFYHFLYISRSIGTSTSYMCPSNTRLTSSAKMGFREIDGYVVRDVKRDPEVSRLKPGHVQVLFWIIPKDKMDAGSRKLSR